MFTRVVQGKRPRPLALLAIVGALVAAGLLTAVALAALTGDTNCTRTTAGTSIEVANKNQSATCLTDKGAIVEYIGSSANNQSSGTGTFNPFVRLQATGLESGFNTDAAVTLDTKAGSWTHSILVSDIPVVTINGVNYWELFVDINESNSTPRISLNKVEIYFTTNPDLTGYPASFPAPEYSFSDTTDAILINDVNQGSGRGDVRYLVPLNGAGGTITIPQDCNYGNDDCNTFFVLYSQWGGAGSTYLAEGGFDEWKVKVYPVVSTTLTTVSQTPSGTVVPGTAITIVVRETNTGDDTLTNVFVSGTGCTVWTPANVASLAPGAFADFTCTFSPTADTAWTADGHGTDSLGNPAPSAGEQTSGNVDVNDTTTASSAQDWLPNDTATITSAGGTALNGSLTIALYTGDNCGVTSGSAVAGQSYPFTLVNEASGTSHSTSNLTYKVLATSTVSWLVTFTSSDPAVQSDTHCESTALTITN